MNISSSRILFFEFLEEKLAEIGLNAKETNEFIVYWLPGMQENKYNLITFQTEAYTDIAKLHITPEPNSVLRVFMAYKELEAPIKIEKPAEGLHFRRCMDRRLCLF